MPRIVVSPPKSGDRLPIARSYSNPAINNFFDGTDASAKAHLEHDHASGQTLAHICGDDRLLRTHTVYDVLDEEMSKTARRLKLVNMEQRALSKRSAAREHSMDKFGGPSLLKQMVIPGLLVTGAVTMMIICSIWSNGGTLFHEIGIAHLHKLKTRPGHIASPLYTALPSQGNVIPLHGHGHEVFDVKIVVMATDLYTFGVHGQSDALKPHSAALHWELLADGTFVDGGTIVAKPDKEVEFFKTVDVGDKGFSKAKHYEIHVNSEAPGSGTIAFLCEVLQLTAIARYRFALGVAVFSITFIFIISEVVHRVYSAFVGSMVLHVVTALTQETPHLHTIMEAVDFGTLMLLFSMMILMHMLSLTGFFEYFTITILAWSRRRPAALFFLLTNASGLLSAMLDNVTVTLLTGPLAFSLAEKTGVKSMPLYFGITIAASIGGTATMVGDPPNIVIGSMMKVGFEKFLIYNLPLTIICLPLSTIMMYYQFRDNLVDKSKLDETGRFNVNMEQLRRENPIRDILTFQRIFAVLCGVFLALLMSPIHKIEPAWFCLIAMFLGAIMFHRHHIESLLEAVEWDTLIFFAILFVVVHSIQELGVIRQIGDVLVDWMLAIPEADGGRMIFSLTLILWVSAIGSAFLESLPYTTTIIALLQDMKTRDLPGINVDALVWALSVGACIGGIGSIMGASTNLTAVAISQRYGKTEEDKVKGWHFFRYGFPILLCLTTVATFYQWIVFVGMAASG